MKLPTSLELDEMVDSIITGEGVDQDKLDKECDQITDALKGSKMCQQALAGAIMHAISRGPEHFSCSINGSIGAFFLIAMKLMEHRQKASKDIDELERLMNLAPGDTNDRS